MKVITDAGVAGQVEVLQVDAQHLSFGEAVFDAILSIDAFEYFGTDVNLLPTLLRVLRPGGAIGMSTPALRTDPYVQAPPAAVTDLVGWEAAAWHAPQWWQRHWELTGLVDDVTARMQPGSRDDWIAWARATGESDNGPLLTMLTSMDHDDIGFALVTAVKTPDRADSLLRRRRSAWACDPFDPLQAAGSTHRLRTIAAPQMLARDKMAT